MDEKTLRRKIYDAALPVLKGKTVTDVIVGLSLLSVELDEKYISVAYTIREGLGSGCSIFPYVDKMTGMKAEDAALWFVEGKDNISRGLGCAVINAAGSSVDMKDTERTGKPFDLDITPADTVGMVGNIQPAVRQMKPFMPKFYIFDRGKCQHGNPDDDIYPMEMQEDLLPKCSIMTLSGTALVNGTAAGVFSLCPNARETVLIGASVPMVPEGFRDTPVTVLAGSFWRIEDKAEIFSHISHAAGMKVLNRYMVKKNVRLN